MLRKSVPHPAAVKTIAKKVTIADRSMVRVVAYEPEEEQGTPDNEIVGEGPVGVIAYESEEKHDTPENEIVSEGPIDTLTYDGPSQSTRVLHTMYRFTIVRKKINKSQIKAIIAKFEEGGSKVDLNRVLAKVQFLTEKIEKKGKATILPCTSHLDKKYLPLMGFFKRIISNMIAESTNTKK